MNINIQYITRNWMVQKKSLNGKHLTSLIKPSKNNPWILLKTSRTFCSSPSRIIHRLFAMQDLTTNLNSFHKTIKPPALPIASTPTLLVRTFPPKDRITPLSKFCNFDSWINRKIGLWILTKLLIILLFSNLPKPLAFHEIANIKKKKRPREARRTKP